jgi:hypothetical protein
VRNGVHVKPIKIKENLLCDAGSRVRSIPFCMQVSTRLNDSCAIINFMTDSGHSKRYGLDIHTLVRTRVL